METLFYLLFCCSDQSPIVFGWLLVWSLCLVLAIGCLLLWSFIGNAVVKLVMLSIKRLQWFEFLLNRMALSAAALRMLIDSRSCHCAADDSPDDMTFGLCLKHLKIPVTHSPLFHQVKFLSIVELLQFLGKFLLIKLIGGSKFCFHFSVSSLHVQY